MSIKCWVIKSYIVYYSDEDCISRKQCFRTEEEAVDFISDFWDAFDNFKLVRHEVADFEKEVI